MLFFTIDFREKGKGRKGERRGEREAERWRQREKHLSVASPMDPDKASNPQPFLCMG